MQYCNFKAQAGTLTKHLLWGQRDSILIASEVEEALLPKATCFGRKALRARAMKTILNDATFIFVYNSLNATL